MSKSEKAIAAVEPYRRAAAAIRDAGAIIITAGAGIGVDSGLPDFRGDRGFWNAYPLYERLGINFVNAANPAHFDRDPAFGWGFYGHRLNLYRETMPHRGFQILLDWIHRLHCSYFVITSNVDGQFQKAGFAEERICEVHGSIHHSQCLDPCSNEIWENREKINVDLDSMRADPIPACKRCGGVARPNILMFGDYSWISDRTANQEERLDQFLSRVDRKIVVVELGAGLAVPTIRYMSERLACRRGAVLIRINPREYEVPAGHMGVSCGALEGLLSIDAAMKE